MFAGSLVLGITLLCFAAWLHWNETQGWPDERFVTELDKHYLGRRTRSRKRIHFIIAGCGVLILVAAYAELAGLGPLWVAAWMCVIVALLTVVMLAGIDVIRTNRYHRDKLPEVRREVMGDDE